ncbi:C-terminal binding protein [Cohaesibacter haloalkalitolerans]|uniref:C-terminal binding protein n=1 Tax=Cohaesibacter haloalkalitolerans TaxID=1162980 RepID=UPI000E65600B|nr:C-terminal binding protein [Cohaesibacter haloalkalitolerans]
MKVIVSDCDHESMQIETDVLAKAGLGFTHMAARTQDEVIEQCKGGNIILNQYGKFDERVFTALPEVKQIVRYGVGVDNVDLAAATRHGVQVCNVPDYGMHEVSDHALALMMALIRKIPATVSHTRNRDWDFRKMAPIRRITEMTIGVLGAGRIGGLFARKALPLGKEVLVCDLNKKDLESRIPGVRQVDIDELLAKSDVLSIHCPLSDETRNLINAERLKSMKQGAFLINTARGGIVDEEALADLLEAGVLGGAALDCVAQEPIDKKSRLLDMDNVFLTPHMAYYSEESSAELKRKVAEEAVRFAKGEPVHYPVNTL